MEQFRSPTGSTVVIAFDVLGLPGVEGWKGTKAWNAVTIFLHQSPYGS